MGDSSNRNSPKCFSDTCCFPFALAKIAVDVSTANLAKVKEPIDKRK